MTTCPKCDAASGNDWRQCDGACPMPMSPHYDPGLEAREHARVRRQTHVDTGFWWFKRNDETFVVVEVRRPSPGCALVLYGMEAQCLVLPEGLRVRIPFLIGTKRTPLGQFWRWLEPPKPEVPRCTHSVGYAGNGAILDCGRPVVTGLSVCAIHHPDPAQRASESRDIPF